MPFQRAEFENGNLLSNYSPGTNVAGKLGNSLESRFQFGVHESTLADDFRKCYRLSPRKEMPEFCLTDILEFRIQPEHASNSFNPHCTMYVLPTRTQRPGLL